MNKILFVAASILFLGQSAQAQWGVPYRGNFYNERYFQGYGWSSNGQNPGYGANYYGFRASPRYGYGGNPYNRQYFGPYNFGPGVITGYPAPSTVVRPVAPPVFFDRRGALRYSNYP